MEKALVLGAAGQIGTELVAASSEQLLPLEELLEVEDLPHAQPDAHGEGQAAEPRHPGVQARLNPL